MTRILRTVQGMVRRTALRGFMRGAARRRVHDFEVFCVGEESFDSRLETLSSALSLLQTLAPGHHRYFAARRWRFLLGMPNLGTRPEPAMRITIVGGRNFGDHDAALAAHVIALNLVLDSVTRRLVERGATIQQAERIHATSMRHADSLVKRAGDAALAEWYAAQRFSPGSNQSARQAEFADNIRDVPVPAWLRGFLRRTA